MEENKFKKWIKEVGVLENTKTPAGSNPVTSDLSLDKHQGHTLLTSLTTDYQLIHQLHSSLCSTPALGFLNKSLNIVGFK